MRCFQPYSCINCPERLRLAREKRKLVIENRRLVQMTLRDEIARVRIKNIIESKNEFEFPEFVRCLRKSLGIARTEMANDLGYHEMKLYYLESGKFVRMPEISFLASVADYFGIPRGILVRKAKTFVNRQKK